MMAAASSYSDEPRVIALLDIDAFECQIWQRMYPMCELWGRPCVVIDKTGRITSATYEAKALGISREVRIGDARRLANKEKAKLTVFEKPNDREKPDCKETRYASWEILDALKKYIQNYAYGVILEYSSSDEFYLDITEEVRIQMEAESALNSRLLVESTTFLEGQCLFQGNALKTLFETDSFIENFEETQSEKVLAYGALLMQNISNYVFRETKFVSSVGIGANKLMAKLAVSLHRPNGITAMSDKGLFRLGNDIPLEKIPGLGGKTGSQLKEVFNIKTINELRELSIEQLEDVVDMEKAIDFYYKCRGMSDEPVKEKYYYDELNCGKNFTGQIKSDETLYYHLHCLVEEVLDRLEEERSRHSRIPSYVKVKLEYQKYQSPLKNGTKAKEDWFYNIDKMQFKDKKIICDNIIGKIFNGIGDVSRINITRICLSAKQFLKLADVGAGA